MSKTPSRERGLTFISFLMIIGLVGFSALLVLKIGPIYINNYKIRSSLESLKSQPEIASKSKQEIMALLMKRWEVNSVDYVSKDDVMITKDVSLMKVQITYDVTKPILGNVDALVHFNETIEVAEN
jgi:hypothetical protein